ncbi:MAG: dihydrolipoyl dehydrogenase [Clostridia bacterium]|nr:dihydrolipoyl dehydrogenase [Clostridia bacterium]
MQNFDLIILGGGPAGYNAAERAAEAGFKTVVIEKRALGGVCLNEGCIPSKSFLNSAKMLDHARHSEKYGVTVTGASIDHKAVVARKNKVVATLVGGIQAALKGHKVTVVDAEGKIEGKEGNDYKVVANGESYVAPRLLICSGSYAIVPAFIKGAKEMLDKGIALTNREILDLEEVPKKLVIIGGGVIGMEMASYFNSIGSEVTVIEMLDHIGGPTDIDIAKILQKNYEKKGVKFLLGAAAKEVTEKGVVYELNGQQALAEADKVLLSIGRRANTEGIGLESIGVITERGAIVTDERMRTNVPNVYAAGDVNGKSMLAHTAYREGEVAVNNMAGKKDIMRYNAIPSVIYTSPEVGGVGETEATAKAKGYDVAVVKIPMQFSGRYVAENEGGDGICKLIVDKKYDRLIGCHLLTNYASEIIVAAGEMIEAQMRIDEIKEIVFPHPSVAEVIREALYQIKY